MLSKENAASPLENPSQNYCLPPKLWYNVPKTQFARTTRRFPMAVATLLFHVPTQSLLTKQHVSFSSICLSVSRWLCFFAPFLLQYINSCGINFAANRRHYLRADQVLFAFTTYLTRSRDNSARNTSLHGKLRRRQRRKTRSPLQTAVRHLLRATTFSRLGIARKIFRATKIKLIMKNQNQC